MTDQELIDLLHVKVKAERAISLEVLQLICEAEDRGLSGGDTHSWLVKVYRYSGGSAGRRVAAARLLRDVPKLEAKFLKGEVSMSAMAQAQTAIQMEEKREKQRMPLETKAKVAEAVAGKYGFKADQALIEVLPNHNPSKPEKVKAVSGGKVSITLELTQEEFAELQKSKELLSHSLPNQSWAAVVAHMSKRINKQKDPLVKKQRRTGKIAQSNKGAPVTGALRTQILQRDKRECVICGEKNFIEVDHIVPRARGGSNDPSNLRTTCRAHNRYFAEKEFGKQKMEQFRYQPPT